MNFGFLLRGLPGHPLHPPLTDATIGTYTFAVVAGLLDVLGVTDSAAARAWWVALLVGILFSLPTAATGLADWVRIESRTPLWRTATTHMVVMLLATGVFLATIIVGKASYDDGDLTTGAFVLTLVAYGAPRVRRLGRRRDRVRPRHARAPARRRAGKARDGADRGGEGGGGTGVARPASTPISTPGRASARASPSAARRSRPRPARRP